jgi:Peptidase_C39 like family
MTNMKKSIIDYTILVFLFIGFFMVGLGIYRILGEDNLLRVDKADSKKVVTDTPDSIPQAEEVAIKELKPTTKILPVPYVSEAPEGDWSGNWVNACEEATIIMVDGFYAGKSKITIEDAKSRLLKLFSEQDIMYGSSKNSDSKKIENLISIYTNYKGKIKTNPTITNLKQEIDNGNPVISLHKGFDLKNKNIPFSPVKSSYHTVVLVGYDDVSGEFITHDPGDDKDGFEHRYSYDDYMDSLHDYNATDDKADGLPTVIYTKAK